MQAKRARMGAGSTGKSKGALASKHGSAGSLPADPALASEAEAFFADARALLLRCVDAGRFDLARRVLGDLEAIHAVIGKAP